MTEPEDNVNPVIMDADEFADLYADFQQAKAVRDDAVSEVDRLREMLLKMLPDETEAPDGVICLVDDQPRFSYRPHIQRQLDQTRLRLEFPAVVATCTDYVTRWTLRSLSGGAK